MYSLQASTDDGLELRIWTPLVLAVRGEDVTDGGQETLLVIVGGTGQVKAKRLAQFALGCCVEFGASLQLVEVDNQVPGVDPVGGGRGTAFASGALGRHAGHEGDKAGAAGVLKKNGHFVKE